ncbi:S-layer homology domain-containing protein, partial [candidate division KSB1 bacterium]
LVQNAYSLNARIGIGRVYLMKKDYEQALTAFDMVTELDNTDAEAHFYRGMALRSLGFSYRSKTSFIRAILNDDSYRQTVAGIIDLSDNETAKLFKKEYLAIETKPVITRAELAAILITIIREDRVYQTEAAGAEFVRPEMFNPAQEVLISDVTPEHWAYEEIVKAVRSGLMELYPENQFKPDVSVVKADFASLLQQVVVRKLEQPLRATRYIGQISPFTDLNSSHWAYNACRLVSELNLLEAKEIDIFGINEPVGGTAAVVALEKTANLNR